MASIKKRALLELLEQKALRKLTDTNELPVRANASDAALIDAIVTKRSIKTEWVLPEVTVSQLKLACEAVGLDRRGSKQELIDRLSGKNTPTEQQASTAGATKRKSKAPKVPATARASRKAITPMFEQTFKNIDDVLRKEAGCSSELDYTEQTSC